MKKEIDEVLSEIVFDKEKQERVYKQMKEIENKSNFKKFYGRFTTTAIAACLSILILTGVCFAADIPNTLVQAIRTLLEPVNETCISDDIELKTIGAIADNDSIKIYFTLKDLNKNRITEEISIEEFTLSNSSILGVPLIKFDKKTKTATFCMDSMGGSNIKGKNLTMTITSFTDGNITYKGNWKVTFKVKGVETKEINCNIENENEKITKAELSGLGVTIYKQKDIEKQTSFNKEKISLQMKNGEKIEILGGNSTSDETGKEICKYMLDSYIDIKEVDFILINTEKIKVE